MKKLFAGLASVLSLVACAKDAPYGHMVNHSAVESIKPYFFTATSRGPLLVDVHGDYPGFESEVLGDTIRGAMERGMTTRPFKATKYIEEAHSPSYRVYWIISPPKNFNPHRLCKGEIPQSVPQDKPTFLMAFCIDDRLYRDVTGWVGVDVLADSENFKKFVGVVTRDMFK